MNAADDATPRSAITEEYTASIKRLRDTAQRMWSAAQNKREPLKSALEAESRALEQEAQLLLRHLPQGSLLLTTSD
jgi:hypothetical protein